MILVKLGGSVITDKTRKKSFKTKETRRLAREIKESGREVIVVHGAGSFGHILAKQYELQKGYLGENQIKGLAEIQRDVKELNLMVLNLFFEEGIKAVSIPPSAIVLSKGGKIEEMDLRPFQEYLKLGLTPLTFGDVVLDSELRFSICSGDDLMLHLARVFKPEKAVFVADVDGIFTSNPALGKETTLLQEIDETLLPKIEELESEIADVTGSMHSKLRTMIDVSKEGIDCFLLNGGIDGRLRDFLLGKKVLCTKVKGVRV